MTTSSEKKSSVTVTVTMDILSIRIHSEITPCIGGTLVKLPNWEPGIDLNDGPGSKRPGVFEIDNQQYKELEVKVKVEGLGTGEIASLIGELGDMVFEGTFTGKCKDPDDPTQTVLAVPRDIPAGFKWLYGDMDWYVKLPDRERRFAAKTRLELFWIYDYPGAMYKKGVWIEVLRLLGSRCAGLETKDEVLRRMINYCHSGTDLKYDSHHGASHYVEGWGGGAFKLNAYLQEAFAICNCYDLAGALQTLCGALGINEATWIFAQPFGFINQTDLIGRGSCNNPFFLHEGNPAPKIVEINDRKRTGFINHAFCSIKDRNEDVILDACAGPHLGDETKQQYVSETIDTETILYSTDGIPRPGTVGNMEICSGVTDVGGILLSDKKGGKMVDFEDERIKKFKRHIGFDELERGIVPEQGVVFNWPDPRNCPELGDGSWRIKFDEIRVSRETVVKEWILARENEQLKIEIYVSNTGIEASKNRLLILAASTTRHEIPFVKSAERLGHLFIVSNIPAKKNKVIWISHNVCFLIDAHNSSIELPPIINWIQRQTEEHVVDRLSDHLPVIKRVTVSSEEIEVDQEVSIRLEPAPEADPEFLLLEFHFVGDSLGLVQEDKFSLTFRGKSPGITDVHLVLVNTQNLLSSSRPVTIHVFDKRY